ncbi:MAG TPA: FecR domain-containing protein [Saprospiraceae bacterium]|nr:FecR domain-containing protein [Saprospiraceae bacterium]
MNEHFTSYTSITLAGEDSFIRWVRHGEGDAEWRNWIARHTEKQTTIEEARKIVLSLSGSAIGDLSPSGKAELWNRIHNSIQSGTQQRTKKNLKPLWTWGLAAAATLALFVWISNLTASDKSMANAGEKKEVVLPEESAVTLNAESSITYRDKSFNQDRELYLEGEAFFKVQKGSTFTVHTDYGTVTVLGTSFNVIARDGRFEVTCYTGKVKVESSPKEQQIITAGESATRSKSDKKLNRSTFEVIADTPDWMEGKFSYENQPLVDVISELERQYDINVKLEAGLKDLKYTGLFESGNLDSALYLITWPLHLKSSTKGKTVTISR